VLIVTRLDRLARSTRDLLNVLDAVAKAKAGFRSLKDTWAFCWNGYGSKTYHKKRNRQRGCAGFLWTTGSRPRDLTSGGWAGRTQKGGPVRYPADPSHAKLYSSGSGNVR
jgi:hypothetical protein